MNELLPCPFCGCTDISLEDDGHNEWLKCDWCGAIGGVDPAPEFEGEPVAWHWNRRNGDGYKADSLVVGPKATAPEEQVACLHAAAPDLLAALKLQIAYEAAVSGSDGHSRATWMELVKARNAAIAKAEGRSQPLPSKGDGE